MSLTSNRFHSFLLKAAMASVTEKRKIFFLQATEPVGNTHMVRSASDLGFYYNLDNKIVFKGEIFQYTSYKLLELSNVEEAFLAIIKD